MKELPFDKPGYEAWLKTVPPEIRELAEKYPPWFLYRDSATGYRAVIHAYTPKGKVRCHFLAAFNKIDFERDVHDMDPAQLTPCEPPDENEEVGLTIPPEDTNTYIAVRRAQMMLETWHELIRLVQIPPEAQAAFDRFGGMVRLNCEFLMGETQ